MWSSVSLQSLPKAYIWHLFSSIKSNFHWRHQLTDWPKPLYSASQTSCDCIISEHATAPHPVWHWQTSKSRIMTKHIGSISVKKTSVLQPLVLFSCLGLAVGEGHLRPTQREARAPPASCAPTATPGCRVKPMSSALTTGQLTCATFPLTSISISLPCVLLSGLCRVPSTCCSLTNVDRGGAHSDGHIWKQTRRRPERRRAALGGWRWYPKKTGGGEAVLIYSRKWGRRGERAGEGYKISGEERRWRGSGDTRALSPSAD